MARFTTALLCALCFAAHARAQELGTLRFENSGAAAAQPAFLKGVLYLHNFEYADAARSFAEAQTIDPTMVLAYWGEALTHDHPLWGEEDLERARAVLARLGSGPEARLSRAQTPRERALLAAVEALFGAGSKQQRDEAYRDSLAALSARYSADVDIAALHALAILGATPGNDREAGAYMRAAALLEPLLDEHPDHPGVLHYMIHAYDDPVHAPLGLRAARRYGAVAKAAPHALHMPSHIFMALGLWDDVVRANEDAWQASVDRRGRLGLGPEAQNFHSLYWLLYGYTQQGRMADAWRALELVDSSAAARPGSAAVWHGLMMRATLAVNGDSATRARLRGTPRPVATHAWIPALDAFVAGVEALERGDDTAAVTQANALAAAVAQHPGPMFPVMLRALSGAALAASGDTAQGLASLRAAVAEEDATPYEFGPPANIKPPAEMLGESLLRLGRFDEAASAFERALSRAPGRTQSLVGLARARRGAGDVGQ